MLALMLTFGLQQVKTKYRAKDGFACACVCVDISFSLGFTLKLASLIKTRLPSLILIIDALTPFLGTKTNDRILFLWGAILERPGSYQSGKVVCRFPCLHSRSRC